MYYGDRAGEHLRMRRGKYDAHKHMRGGFVITLFLACVGLMLFWLLVIEPPWSPGWLIADRNARHDVAGWSIALSLALGAWTTWAMFRDRWQCIEAYASRFASGHDLLSTVYVPFIAAWYAVVRGFRKVFGEVAEPQPLVHPGQSPVEAEPQRERLFLELPSSVEDPFTNTPEHARPKRHYAALEEGPKELVDDLAKDVRAPFRKQRSARSRALVDAGTTAWIWITLAGVLAGLYFCITQTGPYAWLVDLQARVLFGHYSMGLTWLLVLSLTAVLPASLLRFLLNPEIDRAAKGVSDEMKRRL